MTDRAGTGLLSDDDLVKVTGGYTRRAAQERVLRAIGLRPVTGKGGRLCLTWEAFNAATSGATQPQAGVRPIGPDYSRINGPAA